MKSTVIVVLLVLLYVGLLPAADVIDFVPRHSRQVLQINLADIAGMEMTRDDMIRSVFRQAGFEKGKNDADEFISLIDKILIVTPVLTESETFVFVKTKVKENEFCRSLHEKTGIRQISVKNGTRTEYQIILPETSKFPGIARRQRIFVFTFLTENIAVFAKDSLINYWKYKNLGLSKQKRKYLNIPQALAAGFVEPEPAFMQENPFLPPFQEAVYSLAAGPAGSLCIRAWAECQDETIANQTQMFLQQYIMVGGMLLNQAAPELMQEWINSVKVSRTGTKVFIRGDFSRDFINRLTTASEKLAEEQQMRERDLKKR